MTSMLLTASSACASDTAGAPWLTLHHLLAVTRRNALFLCIGQRGFLVHLGQHRAVRLDPVRNKLPVLAVPLLDADLAVSLMVIAGERYRHHQPVGAELRYALRRYVEVLISPLDILPFERLLAELVLCCADCLQIVDRVD